MAPYDTMVAAAQAVIDAKKRLDMAKQGLVSLSIMDAREELDRAVDKLIEAGRSNTWSHGGPD